MKLNKETIKLLKLRKKALTSEAKELNQLVKEDLKRLKNLIDARCILNCNYINDKEVTRRINEITELKNLRQKTVYKLLNRVSRIRSYNI